MLYPEDDLITYDALNSASDSSGDESSYGEPEFLLDQCDEADSAPYLVDELFARDRSVNREETNNANEPLASGSKPRSVSKRKNELSALNEPSGSKRQKDKPLTFKGEVMIKNFKNQKGADPCGVLDVQADDSDGVLRKIWDYCAPFVHRGVVYNDTIHDTIAAESDSSIALVAWEEDMPSYASCWNFMQVHDKMSKRYFCPSKIDAKTLLSWEDKDVCVILFKYSASVTSKKRWTLLKEKLLSPMKKDRAGAEAISSVNAVKSELKERHGRYLCADDIVWLCWANYICTMPSENRAALIDDSPPTHMVELFSSVPVHSETLLEKGRLDLQVASTVIASYRTNIEQMESDHQQLLNLASLQGQRLAHMREKLTEHEAMINAMKRTVSARETSFSEELARGVTDSNDDQHA